MGFARNDAEQIKMAVVDGAASATAITVTGITANDAVIGIANLTTPGAVSLAGLVITADTIKVTASTASSKILVLWRDVNAG